MERSPGGNNQQGWARCAAFGFADFGNLVKDAKSSITTTIDLIMGR